MFSDRNNNFIIIIIMNIILILGREIGFWVLGEMLFLELVCLYKW